MEQRTRLKAALFDLDDTLYGSFKECDRLAYVAIGQYAQRELGVPAERFIAAFAAFRAKLARSQPGMPPIHDRTLVAQGALESLGISPMRHASRISRVYWQAVFENMEIRPGVREILHKLRQAGVKIALCTDMMTDIQMEKLVSLGIDDLIDYMATSEEAGHDKPAPNIFRLALEKCGCTAAEAVMVGDNFVHDVQGALDCGIRGIWLNWTDLPTPNETRAYDTVRDFATLNTLFDTMI